MHNYMSLYNITFLPSLKMMHRFAANSVFMTLGWTPTKFFNMEVLPNIFHRIMGDYVQFLYKNTDKNHPYLFCRGPRVPIF